MHAQFHWIFAYHSAFGNSHYQPAHSLKKNPANHSFGMQEKVGLLQVQSVAISWATSVQHTRNIKLNQATTSFRSSLFSLSRVEWGRRRGVQGKGEGGGETKGLGYIKKILHSAIVWCSKLLHWLQKRERERDRVCVCVCTGMHVHVHMHVCMRVSMHACVCVCERERESDRTERELG